MSSLSSADLPTKGLRVGDLVGNYRIAGVIADGGMGIVYRASHVILPRCAAIKVLHPNMIGEWSANERLLQEARLLDAIAGPSAVQIYDAGLLDDGRPWVAMELIEGETLADYLGRRGAIAPDEVGELLIGLADALAPAHERGVVHRDVKPDNIMLRDADVAGARAVKLIDWGIARVPSTTSARLTQVDITLGTPYYMAPEQIRGHALDGRADIYALGIVAFELLTGRVPFQGAAAIEIVVGHLTEEPPSLGQACPCVPVAMESMIMRMLAKDPAMRPSLDEIRATLIDLRLDQAELDPPEMPEIVVETGLELEAVLVALEHEQMMIAAAPLRGRMRWTPRINDSIAGIASAIARTASGEFRSRR